MISFRTSVSPISKFAARARLLATMVSGLLLVCTMLFVPPARAQGSRKDDIVFGAQGKPVAGATITVCTDTATGTPCSPLATLYTDDTLTVVSPNPFTTDGLGNYHFYAPPARYIVQISGPGITTYTISDVILPNDPTTPSFNSITSSGGITATTLTLGGNLSVSGAATITGELTAGTFNIMNFSPTSLTVTGNTTIQGPRPRVDVTAYGAKGDGVTDDTAAIQAAINAVCRAPSASGGGALYFPPTTGAFYYLTQPSGNGPVFNISACVPYGITFEGGASSQGNSPQFSRNPMTRLHVQNVSSGGLGPVFQIGNGTGTDVNQTVTFQNMSIEGYNQAVNINVGYGVVFSNVALLAQLAQGGVWNCAADGCTTDNTALGLYSALWIWADQLALQAPVVSAAWQANTLYSLGTLINSGTGYEMKVTTAGTSGGTTPGWPAAMWPPQSGGTVSDGGVTWTNIGNYVGYSMVIATSNAIQDSGIISIKNSTGAGPFLLDSRAPTLGMGNIEFKNVITESNGNEAFLTILNTYNIGGAAIGPLNFENSGASDCAGSSSAPLIYFNAPSDVLSPVNIASSYGCSGSSAPIYQAAGVGTVSSVDITGSGTLSNPIPIDSNNNPIVAWTENLYGFDSIVNTSDLSRLDNAITTTETGVAAIRVGPALRMTPSGTSHATLALDPGQTIGQGGILFADGSDIGYDSSIVHPSSSPLTLDVAFAAALPPTGLGVAASGSGSSCSAGTYYYLVTAYSTGATVQSTASAEVMATLTAGQNAVLTWTPSLGSNVGGYQVYRATTTGGEFPSGVSYNVAGGSSATYTDTCTSGTNNLPPHYNQTLAAYHVFSQRKLGVDNAAPAAQLDVIVQDAATVGFSVKSATSPAANVWQVTDSSGTVRESVDNNLNLVVGRHLAGPSANGDLAGRISISSGTSGSHSFSTAFISAPVCTASPAANPGTLTWWVTTTTGAVTVNLSASGTLAFNYICVGNPN